MFHSHIWKIVGSVIRKEKVKSLLMMVAIAGSIVVALYPPLILEKMVNTLSNKQEVLLTVAFMYLLIFAISGMMESIQNIMITMVGQSITHEMRSVMSLKLQALPTGYYTSHETGKITSRFVNDVDAVDLLFTNGIISMVADAFKIISIMIVIFVKSRGLGFIMCVVTPLLFVMTMYFQKKMRSAQIRNREAVAKVNAHVPETIQNIRMIHTNSCENYMEKKYDSYIEAGYKAMDQSNFYDSIYSPIIIMASTMIIAVMMVFAAQGESMQALFGISVGSAVAMIAYVGKVFDPLESLGMEIQNIQSALAGVQRIDEFLDETEDVKRQMTDIKMDATGNLPRRNLYEKNEITQKNEQLQELQDNNQYAANDQFTENEIGSNYEGKPYICFEHVRFHYEDGRDIFTDENFEIQQGDSVVFTGRTGAGKSTLFKLLLGLYTPTEGKITINGVPSNEIHVDERRHLFGYVEQHFAIVDGTIRDQITLFDDRISDEAVGKALDESGLKDKVDQFAKKLDEPMKITDFSQGELQLLSIARALAAKPEIMLLDEMTANLDSVTEQRILDIIRRVAEGRTVLSISHRMSEKLEGTRIIVV